MSPFEERPEVIDSVIHHLEQAREVSSDLWLDFVDVEAFAAVIFDCDGTLVESAEAHMKSMQAAAKEQGHEMTAAWYRARTGLDRASLLKDFRAATDPEFDVERASETSIAGFGEFAHLVTPKESVFRFASSLQLRGVAMAVATNAERDVAEVSLRVTRRRNIFKDLVSISDGVAPKPSPEMFLLAAKRLGYPPSKVLVVEDSPQGVQAALDAGMSVIQLD